MLFFFYSITFFLFSAALGMSIALNVLVFFIGSFTVAIFNTILILLVLGAGIVLKRFAKAQNLWETSMVFAGTLLLLHIVGDLDGSLGFELYHRYSGYDTFLHFLGGLTVGIYAATFWSPKLPHIQGFLPVIAAAIAGIAWELLELGINHIFNLGLSSGSEDTKIDLLSNIGGGTLAGLYFFFWIRRPHVSEETRQQREA